MRCPVCGHVRTRLDPLPDTHCPNCDTQYAVAEQKVRLGLIKPAPEPVQRRPRTSNRSALPGLVFVISAALLVGWWLRGSQDSSMQAQPSAARTPAAPAMAGRIGSDRPVAAQPQVIMYSTAWCGVCAKTRRYFSQHGIRYTELDVEKDPRAWQEYRQYPGDGVPLVVIGERARRGFDPRWIRDQLASAQR
jgi:glutaredoxin